jgi:FkbM family methyltransferase
VASFSILLYRLYFLPKHALGRVVRRWPSAQGPLNLLKTIIRRVVLPKRRVWLQVQKGLSQGMWMRLVLPEGARYWHGEHDPEMERALQTAVWAGAAVYDIGAHFGYFALGVARLVGDTGRVVAFEGDPDNVVCLRENVSKNELEARLLVVHAAVWSNTSGDGISFRRGVEPRAQGGVEADESRPVAGNAELIRVPVITLDDFVARGGPVPNVIKIDVEGGEHAVFEGAAELFANGRPLVIAEVHHVQAAEQIGRWLEAHQYRVRWNIGKEPYPRQLLAWPTEYDGESWMRRFDGTSEP